MLRDPYRKATILFTALPYVFFMQMKFYKYDFKQDQMITVRIKVKDNMASTRNTDDETH